MALLVSPLSSYGGVDVDKDDHQQVENGANYS